MENNYPKTQNDIKTDGKIAFSWKVYKTLCPGKDGTLKELEKFGGKLVGVRSRKNKAGNYKVKTIEIIINEGPIKPKQKNSSPDKLVYLKIGWKEKELQQLVRDKEVNGKWDKDLQCWVVSYKKVVELGLEKRIVENPKES